MQTIFWLCIALVIYHSAIYPLIVLAWARVKQRNIVENNDKSGSPSFWPSVTIIVPAFNEARYIQQKIANLAAFEYHADALKIVIALDGCTDNTAELARSAIAASAQPGRFELKDFSKNRGKTAVLNDEIAQVCSDLLALTDVSAVLPADALVRLVRHFRDPAIGLVCPTYVMAGGVEGGEAGYWSYQTAVKNAEGIIAAPIGPHGAFYVIRRALWEPLSRDVINDDFVMPMRIVLKGAGAVYDASVVAAELERSTHGHDFRRRMRLGAGNMQQTVLLAGLANPARGALAFLFISGKGLRAFVPLLVVLAFAASIGAALQGSPLFCLIVAAQIAGLLILPLKRAVGAEALPGPVVSVAYALQGIIASAYGAISYLLGSAGGLWTQSTAAKDGVSLK